MRQSESGAQLVGELVAIGINQGIHGGGVWAQLVGELVAIGTSQDIHGGGVWASGGTL